MKVYDNNMLRNISILGHSGDVVSSLSASDAAIIVVDATTDIQVGTDKALELAKDIPKIMFINKIDNEKARYKDTLSMLRDTYGNKVVPMLIPIYKNKEFVKLHNIFENMDGLDGEFKEEALTVKESLMELIAETDDEILDKYFSGEELTAEEIQKGLTVGMQRGDIIPVICGSTVNNIGTKEVLDTVSKYLEPKYKSTEEKFKGVVFKTFVDPFIGKMSYLKVVSGKIEKDNEIYNINKSNKERISNIYTMKNKELVEVGEANCGDIVVLTKANSLQTGDTVSLKKEDSLIDELKFPKPQIYFAIEPKNKGDEDKISSALNKMTEEDPTIQWYRNPETKQALIGVQGELHLNIIKDRMKEKFGADVELNDLKVAYRETIKGTSDVQGKHKKQSGGHGQYGDVKIKFERCENDFEFAEAIFGGSVPKQYIPAVEKGLKDSMIKGVLAGFPVTNIKATLYDGSYHDVDSSEMAFKMAASQAFKKGMEMAQPILLEPIMQLKIVVPDEYMGDVMGDINKRRGRILGMEPLENGKQVIYAQAPQSETFKYAIDLRSITQGRGQFEMEIDKYEEVPHQIAQKIISEMNNN